MISECTVKFPASRLSDLLHKLFEQGQYCLSPGNHLLARTNCLSCIVDKTVFFYTDTSCVGGGGGGGGVSQSVYDLIMKIKSLHQLHFVPDYIVMIQ